MKTSDTLRLIQWANGVNGAEFEWGATDCIALGIGAVAVIRGVIADAPCQWTDEGSARAAMASFLPSAWMAECGAVAVDASGAQVGDVMLAPGNGFPECAHVHLGKYALTSTPAHGVGYVRTADVLRAATSVWRFD